MDNGGPFGSTGPAGLSRLSAWWTALGDWGRIHSARASGTEWGARTDASGVQGRDDAPAFAPPASAATAHGPLGQDLQRIRPHEALGQRPPAEVYRPRSPGDCRSVALSYHRSWAMRRVRSNGQIKWRGRKRFVGEAFVGYPVGLKLRSGGKCEVLLCRPVDWRVVGIRSGWDAPGQVCTPLLMSRLGSCRPGEKTATRAKPARIALGAASLRLATLASAKRPPTRCLRTLSLREPIMCHQGVCSKCYPRLCPPPLLPQDCSL